MSDKFESEKNKTLAAQPCIPCSGSMPAATSEEIVHFNQQLSDWSLIEVDNVSQLQKEYLFKNFRRALAFTNEVGGAAEAAGHHPALLTEWGKVTITWWTHAIKGLHRNDFVMAAKTDEISARFRNSNNNRKPSY